jgi:Protein of unknown function (DUF1573)
LNCTKTFIVFSVLGMLAPCMFSQQASVSPLALEFAPEVINLLDSGSQPQAITVTNTGKADLVISSVFASGGYKQTNNCSTVPPQQSCTVEVTFNPGTIGNLNGAITITDNTLSNPEVVSLSGKGLAPAQLSPNILSFGPVAVGTTSQPQALILTAAPTSTLSINQIAVSGNFLQTNNCPSSLQGGKSCTINVVFQPTVNAAVQGALAVSTDVETTALAFSVTLTGTGSGNVVSHVSVQPAILNFGNKGPDRPDSVKKLTLTNTSVDTSLNFQNVSLSGSPNAVGAFPMYKINSNTCEVLPPGAHCTVEVAFSTLYSEVFPQGYPAAVTISDSDPTSPQVIGISAKQVGQVTFKPASLVFPPQPVNTTTTKTFSLTGNDLEGGILLSIATAGDFSETDDLSSCLQRKGAKCNMSVSFTPGRTGVIKGSVTIETYPECPPDPRLRHKCPSPVVLNLTGTGK